MTALHIFVDLAKAFETMSHNKLLTTLENIVVRGTPLKLFTFLSERIQFVRVKNSLNTSTMKYGVPQGSVLLFVINEQRVMIRMKSKQFQQNLLPTVLLI